MMRMWAPESLDVYFLTSDIVDGLSKRPSFVQLGFASGIEEIRRLGLLFEYWKALVNVCNNFGVEDGV